MAEPPKVRVTCALAVAEGTSMSFERDLDYFQVRIGSWIVELIDGNLRVRGLSANVEVLTTPAVTSRG